MCCISVKGKIENLKKVGKMRIRTCTQNFTILNQVVAEKTDKKCPYVLYRSGRRKN